MISTDALAEQHYAARDPQFEDPDAFESDKVNKLGELYEATDELARAFYQFLEEYESYHVRIAYGCIQRALAWLEMDR